MFIELRCGLILVSLILLTVILIILKKGRIPVKYSLIWLFSSVLILLLALFPNMFWMISKMMGFVTMSNMIIGIFIFILLIITLSLTVIVSGQKKKNTLLIQEISILKEKIGEKNEK